MSRLGLKQVFTALLWHFLMLVAPIVALAEDDPWTERNSEHFTIYYPANRAAFAELVLTKAEKVYERLSDLLDSQMEDRVDIHIEVKRDEALPCNQSVTETSMIITAWPDPDKILGRGQGDWLEQQIAHNLAHILTLNTSSMSGFLKQLLGVIAHNNRYAPTWYMEGVAKYFETPDNPGQSIRQPAFRALVEAMARADLIPSLGQLNAGTRHWPADQSNTLFGAAFIEKIARDFGEEIFGQWNLEYARDMVPFSIQRTARLVLGNNWDVFYDAWRKKIKLIAQERPYTDEVSSRIVLTGAWRNDRVRAVPNANKISYVRDDGLHPRAIVVLDLDTKTEQRITECQGWCEHHWSQDGKRVFYSTLVNVDDMELIQRVYVYDLEKHTRSRIAIPDHVRSFTLDGDRMWAAVMKDDINELYELNVETEFATPKKLLQTEPFERMDGLDAYQNSLVTSIFDPHTSVVHLERIDLTPEGAVRVPISLNDVDHIHPIWLDTGNILYIRSDVWSEEVWVVSRDGKYETRLTRMAEGVSHPAVGNDGSLLFTEFSANGSYIAAIPENELKAITEPWIKSILEAEQAAAISPTDNDNAPTTTDFFIETTKNNVETEISIFIHQVLNFMDALGITLPLHNAADFFIETIIAENDSVVSEVEGMDVSENNLSSDKTSALSAESMNSLDDNEDDEDEDDEDESDLIKDDLNSLFDISHTASSLFEEAQPYQVWRQLVPSIYTPLLNYTENSGVGIGFLIGGEDVLEYHKYDIHFDYYTAINAFDTAFNYIWTQYAWDLGAGTGMDQRTVLWSVENEYRYLNYVTYWAELYTQRDWHFPTLDLALELKYRTEYSRPLDQSTWNAHDNNEDPVRLPQLGWTSALMAKLELSKKYKAERTFVDFTGFAFTTYLRIEAPFLGAEDYTFINEFQLITRVPMPYLETHVLGMTIQGGYAYSENETRQPFEILSASGFSFNDDNVQLHGYRRGLLFGQYDLYTQLQYTALLAEFQAGMTNFPLGFNRLGAAVQFDMGMAWTKRLRRNDLRYSVGAEVYLDGMVAYHLPFRVSYGFARGLADEGESYHYFLLSW